MASGQTCSWSGKMTTDPETTDWRQIALNALSSLRACGIDVSVMVGMTPEVLAELENYQREETAFS